MKESRRSLTRWIYDEIQDRYIRALSGDELRLLKASSLLPSLNEQVCVAILPDESDLDDVDVSRILRGLSDRVIIHQSGVVYDGLNSYSIHSRFREYLLNQYTAHQRSELSWRAFMFYKQQLLSTSPLTLNDSNDANRDLQTEVEFATACLRYLPDSAVVSDRTNNKAGAVGDFFYECLRDGRLEFYTITLLLSRIRLWRVDRVAEPIVEDVLDIIRNRKDISRYLLDQGVDSSWIRELFHRSSPTELSESVIQCLQLIVAESPEFVAQIIVDSRINDERKQRRLVSVARKRKKRPRSGWPCQLHRCPIRGPSRQMAGHLYGEYG